MVTARPCAQRAWLRQLPGLDHLTDMLADTHTCASWPYRTDTRASQDVEKAAAKVGVVLQSVKEVLLGMVADDLVHEDRIGASKYYWAFPSEAATKVRGAGNGCAVRALVGPPADCAVPSCRTGSATGGP